MANKFEYPTDFEGTFWTTIDGDYYVSTIGSDINGDGTPQKPYLTIRKAMDFAEDGEKVVIGPEEYVTETETTQVSSGSLLPCRVATTQHEDLESGGLLVIDGVTVQAGDRVLVWQQNNPTQNGVYLASANGWLRVDDFGSIDQAISGLLIPILGGSTYANDIFQFTTPGDVVIGSDPLTFEHIVSENVTWGDIDGSIEDQDDLKIALDAKLNVSDFGSYLPLNGGILSGGLTLGGELRLDAAGLSFGFGGDTYEMSVSDNNPIHNGTSAGATINWKGDNADYNLGHYADFFHGDHIQAVNGFYIGAIANNGTQVIDASRKAIFTSINLGSNFDLLESTDRSGLFRIQATTDSWAGMQTNTGDTLWSFMGSDTQAGIYDDTNSEWVLKAYENAQVELYHNGTIKLSTNSGGVQVTGNITATNFELSSDLRGKDVLETIGGSDIEYIKFKNKESDQVRYGVAAQQVQEILPELVNEGVDGQLKVSYIDLLIRQLAKLEKEVEELKSKSKDSPD